MNAQRPDNLAAKLAREEQEEVSAAGSSGVRQRFPRAMWLAKLFGKHKLFTAAFLLAFYLLLVSPLFQLAFEPIPRKGVSGLHAPDRVPRFSRESFFKGSFQKRAEEWFLKRHGLWGYLVRASNEVSYRLFNQVSANYGSTVLVGRDEQLFQPMYLNTYNKTNVPTVSLVEQRVRDLKELQTLLARRGIVSTVLISTNVLSFYPELIPDAFTDPTRVERQNSYEISRPMLDKYGVDYIDGHQLLTQLKPRYPFRLFETSASHWNDVAACRVTQVLGQRLEKLLGKELPEVSCEPVAIESGPRVADRDLLAIGNLFFPKHTYRPAPYVELPEEPRDAGSFKPKLLFVGTSFCFSMMSQLKRHGISDRSKLFFYYRHVHDSRGRNRSLDRWRINWAGDIFTHDAIIIEANVAGMGIAGYNFVGDALNQLRHEEKAGKLPAGE